MERIDDLQLKGLKLIQDDGLFCFGEDAVLLADFACPRRGTRIVDLGTGTGILPLLLYGREPDIQVDAVELQPELCALARRSVALNGLEFCIRVAQGDIRDASRMLGGGYDVAVCNPPYDKAEAAIMRMAPSHRIARFETHITLQEVCEAAARLLRSGGKLYMIHRGARLAEIFGALRSCRLEPKELRCIHSYQESAAERILVCAAKDGRPALKIHPPLIVHQPDGSETQEIRKIYNRDERHGEGYKR